MSTTGRMDKQITTFTKLNTTQQKEEKRTLECAITWSNLRNVSERSHSVCMKSKDSQSQCDQSQNSSCCCRRSGKMKTGLRELSINDENALHFE